MMPKLVQQILIRVYMQFAICGIDPQNTDMKQICLQICGNGGVCRGNRLENK